eukprot:TRINITY_DN3144_c0_g1_i1.p1 TRINITY_DN3144_c0_g1~~TRINITY_DN3144_c0_g1_i1.p1  ORF type:complete len:513 (+),score=72.21 TRINITY_DN3144_c0_g1_i1:138-1541(+)
MANKKKQDDDKKYLDSDEDISISVNDKETQNHNNQTKQKITNKSKEEKSADEQDQKFKDDTIIPEIRTYTIKDVKETEVEQIKTQIFKKADVRENEVKYAAKDKTLYITTPYDKKKEQDINKVGNKIQKNILSKPASMFVADIRKVHFMGKSFASINLNENQLKKIIIETLIEEAKDVQIERVEKPIPSSNWGFIICSSPQDAEKIINQKKGTTTHNNTYYSFDFDVCKPSKKNTEKSNEKSTEKSETTRNFNKQFETMEIDQQLETIIILIKQSKQQQYIIDKINEMNNPSNDQQPYEKMDIEEDKKPKTLKRKAETTDKQHNQKKPNTNNKKYDNEQQQIATHEPNNHINQMNTIGQNTVNFQPNTIANTQTNQAPTIHPIFPSMVPPTWVPHGQTAYGPPTWTMYGTPNPYYPQSNQYNLTNQYGQPNQFGQQQTQPNNANQIQLMQLMAQNPQLAMQLGYQKQ